ARAKLVAWVIACCFNQREYLDGNGLRAWPSLVTIAKRSGQNKKRVLLAIADLKEAGYIIVEARYDAKTQRHKSNNYWPKSPLQAAVGGPPMGTTKPPFGGPPMGTRVVPPWGTDSMNEPMNIETTKYGGPASRDSPAASPPSEEKK